MKKLMVVFIAFVFSIVVFNAYPQGSGGRPIRLTYQFGRPSVSAVDVFGHPFQEVKVLGTDEFSKEGAPELPVRVAKILLPYGREAGKINVIAGKKVALKGVYNVKPGQRPVRLSRGSQAEYIPPDPSIYGAVAGYPKSNFVAWTTQVKKGYRILTVELFPVTYHPVSGKLSYYEELTLIVHTKPQKAAPRTYRGLAKDAAEVRLVVDNPELLATYPTR